MMRTAAAGFHGHHMSRIHRTQQIRRWMVGLVMALVVLPVMATDDLRELRLASDSWPPFTDTPEKQRVAVELVHTALERAGIAADTTVVLWKEVEKGLQNATFDGCAAMWHTSQRESELVFSRPYFENRLVLIGRKGSDVSATSFSELAGKRVALVGRYAYGDEVDMAQGVHFVGGHNDQENLTKLLAGEVEYMVVDALVASYLLEHQSEEAGAKLEIGSEPLARRKLYFTVRKDVPGADEIVEAFNREIQTMLSDGTYSKILQLGWIQADVDGDGLVELVALGGNVGDVPPGTVYDVFGEAPTDTPIEKQRIFIQGSIFEGWNAIPEQFKAQGPASPMDVTLKQGTTVFTLQF